MPFVQPLVLGFIQGLTELLPISSSGHLILVPKIFGWSDQGLAFDVVVHLGTLLAIIILFWTDIKKIVGVRIKNGFSLSSRAKSRDFTPLCYPQNETLRQAQGDGAVFDSIASSAREPRMTRGTDWYSLKNIIIAIIPAGLVGFLLADFIESNFRSAGLVATNLIFWGVVLWIADRVKRFKTSHLKEIKLFQALTVGLAQVLALLPGTSRSGITITAGLFNKFSRQLAVKFSFLISLPLILSSGILKVSELVRGGIEPSQILSLLTSFLAAFLSGLLAIKFILYLSSRSNFNVFVIYRIVLGIIILIFL